MRTLKDVVVPERPYHETVRIVCDLCGAEAKGDTFDGSSWTAEEIDLEVKVVMTEGTRYPEGYDTRRAKIDLCPTCFKEKLIPFVNENGVNHNVADKLL